MFKLCFLIYCRASTEISTFTWCKISYLPPFLLFATKKSEEKKGNLILYQEKSPNN